MQIDIVGVADIDRVWPKVVADVVRCLQKAPSDIGAGDVWANCRSGQWFLIIGHDGQTIYGTTVWRFANGFLECLILVGGKFDQWFGPLIEKCTAIAVANGCSGLIATHRPALTKQIKKLNPKAKAYRVTTLLELPPCHPA